jgi:hypothetical protein
MKRTSTLLMGMLILAALASCNPTWTTQGKPNDASMPLPPDAKAPTNAGQAQQPASKP